MMSHEGIWLRRVSHAVIRTQEDKGVVLLLDDRFAQSEYARLFPKHWSHLEYLRDTKELKKKLEDFWKG